VITLNLLAKLNDSTGSRWNRILGRVDRHSINCQKLKRRGLVIGTMEEDVEPTQYWDNLLKFQDHVQSRGLDFCLFLNVGSRYWNCATPGVVVEYVDFMLFKTWKYHIEHDTPNRYNWNSSGKILFLTGKPNKVHRAPVVWKFHKQNHLKNFEWSLFVPLELESSVRRFLPDLTGAEWQEFLSLQRSPDNITPIVSGNQLHYYGFPIGKNVYTETSVSLVSETFFDQTYAHPRATEKLWKAITYQHPFVVMSSPGLLQVLQQMGYRTFNQHLPFPEYDQEFNHTLRIDQACENILALHKLAVENPDILINDINHNYQINKSRFESDTKLVADTLKKFEYYGEVFDVIPTHDSITDEKSTEYYEEIKL
jgi:hypothetical protein